MQQSSGDRAEILTLTDSGDVVPESEPSDGCDAMATPVNSRKNTVSGHTSGSTGNSTRKRPRKGKGKSTDSASKKSNMSLFATLSVDERKAMLAGAVSTLETQDSGVKCQPAKNKKQQKPRQNNRYGSHSRGMSANMFEYNSYAADHLVSPQQDSVFLKRLFCDNTWMGDHYRNLYHHVSSLNSWSARYCTPNLMNKSSIRVTQQVNTENLDDSSSCMIEMLRPYECLSPSKIADTFDMKWNESVASWKHCEVYGHALGSVWGLEFCPTLLYDGSSRTETRYLAVSTSSVGWDELYGVGFDYPFEVADTSITHPNLLQIYRVLINLPVTEDTLASRSEQSSDAAPSVTMELSYLIGMDDVGPVWDLKWCPVSTASNMSNDQCVLGLLAMVCGDGKCRVALIPNISSPIEISSPAVLPYTSLVSWEFTVPSDCILSVAWQISSTPTTVACGLASGGIVLWNISAQCIQSPTAPDCVPPSVISQPSMRLTDLSNRQGSTMRAAKYPSSSGVRSLEFCPYHPSIVASVGYDSTLKIWHLEDRYCPKYSKVYGSTWLTSVAWDSSGCSVFNGSSISNSVNMNVLWNQSNESRYAVSMYSHPFEVGSVYDIHSIALSPFVRPYVLSASSDGSVVGRFLTSSRKPTNSVPQLFRVVRVVQFTSNTDVDNSSSTECVAEIVVDSCPRIIPYEQKSVVRPLSVAMHRVDSCPIFSAAQEFNLKHFRLVAYGGAAGLFRVHVVNTNFLMA